MALCSPHVPQQIIFERVCFGDVTENLLHLETIFSGQDDFETIEFTGCYMGDSGFGVLARNLHRFRNLRLLSIDIHPVYGFRNPVGRRLLEGQRYTSRVMKSLVDSLCTHPDDSKLEWLFIADHVDIDNFKESCFDGLRSLVEGKNMKLWHLSVASDRINGRRDRRWYGPNSSTSTLTRVLRNYVFQKCKKAVETMTDGELGVLMESIDRKSERLPLQSCTYFVVKTLQSRMVF